MSVLQPPYTFRKPGDNQPFSFRSVFEYPDGELNDSCSGGLKDKSICIIGGGVAGLTVAYELLTRTSAKVTLFEATDRLGGRVRTHRFDGASYGELGAMRIPHDHLGVRHYIEQFGLESSMGDFRMRNDNAFYYFVQTRARQHNWRKLLEPFQIKASAACANQAPVDYLTAYLKPCRERLDQVDGWEAFRDPRRRLLDKPPLMQVLDNASVWQYFCDSQFRKWLRKTYSELDLRASTIESDQWEYLGRTSGTLWIERGSLVQYLLELGSVMAPEGERPRRKGEDLSPMSELRGGLDQLIQEFRRRIEEAGRGRFSESASTEGAAKRSEDASVIHTDTVCRRVDLQSNPPRVRVEWHSKFRGRGAGVFDYVVCAVPPKATLEIQWQPSLRYDQLYALTNISVESLAKALVKYDRRWWEPNNRPEPNDPQFGDKGDTAPIAGGASHTDLHIQQCWYPSDNAKKAAYSTGHRFVPANVLKSQGPGVLTIYMWGHNSRRFAALDSRDRDEWVLSSLEELHGLPNQDSKHRALVKDVTHFAWDTVSNPLGGAITYFGPGERARYQNALCHPHSRSQPEAPKETPGVYFAGEHLGIVHGWMQSAISSAWWSVKELCGRDKKSTRTA
jgi:monoamine oxidase